ncbi:cation efflux protein [Coleophoma crateriformis]|uniref:Cation efflux protein n=1 Tax=Coleophoma crateriformis TaxID=565419 RepID=A0A3D8SNA4_9HELO|nr:cation efflux protein [Coleophoma crateriformis]
MAWSKSTRITVMLGIDAAFFLLELGVGVVVGSLALMADAFHMLNDIISLAVGLWAVKAAQKATTDKYSFGWLRAEILGAFFNAVFLIALCLSIVLEAVTRLLDPPDISNPVLILVVGCLGLASNLAGFFVLGGHGHSHGPGESHDHSHGDEIRDAEEGHSHSHEAEAFESEPATEIFTEALVGKASKTKHLKFHGGDEDSTLSHGRSMSRASSKKHRRRASSGRGGRFSNLEDISIHPASFRQDIIAASKPQLEGIESEDYSQSDDEAVTEDGPTERSPLLSKSNGNGAHKHSHSHSSHGHSNSKIPRRNSLHAEHNHNKPKKPSAGGHGHSHDDMGMNAMILHVIGDALGNVGVIVSALVIWLTTSPYRFYADPAVSLFITLIILKSCIPLTSATAKILLQATPDHIDVNDIKEDIQDIPGVISCHHVHIWQLSDTQVVASMHIQVAFAISEAGGEKYMELAKASRKCLHAYGIHSATIQPEFCLDKDHDHAEGPSTGLDGSKCGSETNSCLLACVDDCEGRGCCSAPKQVDAQHDHSDHDGHTH